MRIITNRVLLGFRFRLVDSILQLDILIQRIVFWIICFLRISIIERDTDLRLFREQLTQFDRGRHVILFEVFHPAFVQRLVESTETSRFDTSAHIHRSQVGKRNIQIRIGRPSTFFIEVGQAQFVHPNFPTLQLITHVTHTDHDCLHFGKTRITFDTDRIAIVVRIPTRIDSLERHSIRTGPFFPVTLEF